MKQLVITCFLTGLLCVGFVYYFDFSEVVGYLNTTDITVVYWLILAVMGHVLLLSYRWTLLAGASVSPLLQSIKLILAMHTINFFIPLKAGEFAKSWVLYRDGELGKVRSFSIVLYERLIDFLIFALMMSIGIVWTGYYTFLSWCMVALTGGFIGCYVVLFCFRCDRWRLWKWRWFSGLDVPLFFRENRAVQSYYWEQKKVFPILFTTILVWLNAYIQFYLFFELFSVAIPLAIILGRFPIAIFVGLFPFTISGIGTRDGALVYLYQGYVMGELAVAIGLVTTFFRFVIPALVGLPFMSIYLKGIRFRKEKSCVN